MKGSSHELGDVKEYNGYSGRLINYSEKKKIRYALTGIYSVGG